MQQIRNAIQNKKASHLESLPICYSKMVRQCDVRWNSIEASLTLFCRKMTDLGFTFERLMSIEANAIRPDTQLLQAFGEDVRQALH
ncbi:MAG TPA: hypothetical protein VMT30_06405 [Candidatus Saccharimonadia bacterium]|nr:hypothetical protein [Candidatus Saccharimonadia bacterium]